MGRQHNTTHAKIKSEAEILYETLKQYKFLVSLVLWYDMLFQVNFVSKELQCETVDFNTAMVTWLRKLRVNGFIQILVTARELAEDMEVVAIFPVIRKDSIMNLRKNSHV